MASVNVLFTALWAQSAQQSRHVDIHEGDYGNARGLAGNPHAANPALARVRGSGRDTKAFSFEAKLGAAAIGSTK